MRYLFLMAMWLAAASLAAAPTGKDNFAVSQAYAEMQRVAGQVDVLQGSVEALEARLGKAERSGETAALRSEIEALKVTIQGVQRKVDAMHGEIVRELSEKIAKMMKDQRPVTLEKRPAPSISMNPADYQEYPVGPGDNLWLIAKAFGTTVAQIKAANSLSSDSLKIGQKLLIPKASGGSK